nr:hypothetical protein [Tanacetum cinerariifolium]
MGRDTVQLKTAVSTISQEYLLEFTSEYGISEALRPKLPGPEDRIVDFPKGKAWEKYPTMLQQALRFLKKLKQPLLLGGREGVPDYCGLAYECSKRWDAGREYVFSRGCDNTEHTPYPNLETTRGTTLLSRVEPQILPEKRDMDLFNLIRAPNPTKVKTGRRPRAAHEVPLLTVTANRVIEIEDPNAATDSSRKTRKLRPQRCRPPENVTTMGIALEVLRRDHADPWPTESTRGGKSLVAIELGMGSTRPTPVPQGAPVDVSDPDPLSFADPQSHPSTNVAQSSKGAAAAGDPESENTSFASMVGSPRSIYRPEWGITNGSMLDAHEACQDLVDHIALPGYFSELRHLHNDDFLKQYNVNLAQQVSTLQEQVSGEEKLKAAFEEFKRYEDDRVEQRCAEMDERLDALSIDFDEELYPHMLTAIAGIAKGMSEGLKHGVEHGHAKLDLEAIEAYDPKAELMIPMYPEVRNPMDPWACKEEIFLADAIAANGLAILLADAATQTERPDEASPQLLRSISLPVIHG